MANLSATEIMRQIRAELAGQPGGGDPLTGASQNDIDIFNSGNEFIPDTSSAGSNTGRYLENVLNKYDTYSYNISIHMVHPRNSNQFDLNSGTILMADNSQDPRYIVTDVEQIFSVGHGQVRSAYGNKFTIKLSEPNGTSFLESIALSARQLGIESHLHAKYYLTIEFIGRLPDGSVRREPSKFIYSVT